MISLQQKRFFKKSKNFIFKSMAWLAASFSVIIIFLVIIFMMTKVSPISNVQDVINDVIFGKNYNVAKKEFGLAIPLLMTLVTTFLSLIVAIPISVRCAIFIVFRIKSKKIKKISSAIIQLLAGIPSIVFGLFSLNVFGVFLRDAFGMQSTSNIFTAFLTLSFMIMPMITALSINALEAEKKKHWESGIALGTNKCSIIYQIIKPAAKKGIIVGIVIATTRALGESMALSVILQGTASAYNDVSITGFFNNDTPTLASLTARDFLGGDAPADIIPQLRGAFFAGGIAFFIMVFVLNVGILGITNEYSWKRELSAKWKMHKNETMNKIVGRNRLLKLEIKQGKRVYTPIKDHNRILKDYVDDNYQDDFTSQLTTYIDSSHQKAFFRKVKNHSSFIVELLSMAFIFFFVFWIVIDTLIIKAVSVFQANDYKFISANGSIIGDSIGASIATTMILIILVLALSLPIALLVAIYIKEYSKKNSKPIIVAKFFIDALGSTPSIFFGIFGLVFFVETLGVYNPNKSSTTPSILAGGLTMLFVVLPTLIRSMEAALDNVPQTYKEAAIALGIEKWKVITKIILPAAIIGVSTSIILTIGRILSETAPIYLTMGLSPNRPWSPNGSQTLLENGQTLTTRIYANITFATKESNLLIAYEAAFFCVLLIILLNSASYFLSNYVTKKMGFK